MLNTTKNLGNFSRQARAFIINGTRCSAGDGSSCSCPDDGSCSTRKQHIRNEVRRAPTQPKSVSKISTRVVDSLISGDAAQVVSSQQAVAVKHPASAPQAISTSQANVVPNEKPLPIADQFMQVTLSATSFITDIVSGRNPMSAGSGSLPQIHSYMVEPPRPVAKIKPANVKSHGGKYKVQGNSSTAPAGVGNDAVNISHGGKRRSEKSGFTKGYSTVQNHGESSGPSQDRQKVYPPRSNNSNNFVPAVQSPDGGAGLKNVQREVNAPARVAPVTRQFSSSGFRHDGHVSQILRQRKWGPATEEALEKLNFTMDAYQANQILKQVQDHSTALGFFYWLKRRVGFKHDGHTYTTMVGILGRAKQFGEIKKLLNQMIMDGCKPNVVTYNRLIHSYGRANYLNEAVNVFKQMQESGCEPDRVTYCTLIDLHAKAGYLDFAMHMYQRMQAAGLSPDTFTYSVIINCLGKAGNLTAAQKLFNEMVGQGCQPNLVTYNIMIALHAKARNYAVALDLYQKMQYSGFEPDNVTYSIIMEVYGHCGYLENAEAIYEEMKQKNWVPDEPVYGLLVDLWGKAGNAEKAWAWYKVMLSEGLRPNVPTCNSLLSAFLRAHRLEDAYNLLQNMLSLSLTPSLQTYTLLLSCCTEAQNSFDMDFCCDLMAITAHPAHAFLLSMPASGPDGQNVRDHMRKFLDLVHSEERESKRGLVDAVVDFLHKTGLKEEAGSVWEVAAEKNVYPDALKQKSPCYWLINLHVMSDGTAVTALSRTLAWFRRRMLVSGVSPTRIDIVTGWGRRSRITGASMVREAVENLLHSFSSPFFTESNNSGCFVGCGEPLSRWLVASYVERMHLL